MNCGRWQHGMCTASEMTWKVEPVMTPRSDGMGGELLMCIDPEVALR